MIVCLSVCVVVCLVVCCVMCVVGWLIVVIVCCVVCGGWLCFLVLRVGVVVVIVVVVVVVAVVVVVVVVCMYAHVCLLGLVCWPLFGLVCVCVSLCVGNVWLRGVCGVIVVCCVCFVCCMLRSVWWFRVGSVVCVLCVLCVLLGVCLLCVGCSTWFVLSCWVRLRLSIVVVCLRVRVCACV